MRRRLWKFVSFGIGIWFAGMSGKAAFAENYAIDAAESESVFVINHTIGFNSAFVPDMQGSFEADINSGRIKEFDVEFVMGSLTTLNPKRDALLKSEKFFDTTAFANARLKFKKVDGEVIMADVTIRDVTKTVEFDYFFVGNNQNADGKPAARIRLAGKLNRKDFGLDYNVTAQDGTHLLGDSLHVILDLYGVIR